MRRLSKVPLYCNNCGNIMMTDLRSYDGRFCCRDCMVEYEEKRAAVVMGKVWRPLTDVEDRS